MTAERRPRRPRRFGELRRAWLGAYTIAWALTLAAAGVLAIGPAGLESVVRGVLGATLQAQRNPPPNIGHVLLLLAHNLPLAAWPLLLGVLEVERAKLTRQAADILVATVLTVNVLTVGAGLGVYGLALLPYIPQVPLEWAALALGASAWLTQRQRPLTGSESAALFALILGALLCAAILETVSVPHR